MATDQTIVARRPFPWHIIVFLAPAVLVYSALMIFPLLATLFQAFEGKEGGFVGFGNFAVLFGDPRWADSFWNALRNNVWFFIIHMLVQNPIGIALAALLSSPKLRFRSVYRTVFFIPTILSFVIVGFVWKLILSPVWGVSKDMLSSVGLGVVVCAVAGQGRICADGAEPDLGLAIHRHSDDADLCGAAVDPR